MEKSTKMPRLAEMLPIMFDLSKLGVLPPRRYPNRCRTCIYIGRYGIYDLYGCSMNYTGDGLKLYAVILPNEDPLIPTDKFEEARIEAKRRISIITTADNIEASGDALNRLRKLV